MKDETKMLNHYKNVKHKMVVLHAEFVAHYRKRRAIKLSVSGILVKQTQAGGARNLL